MQQVIIGLDTAEMLSEMEALGHSEIDFSIDELDDEDTDFDDEDGDDEDGDDDDEDDENYEKVRISPFQHIPCKCCTVTFQTFVMLVFRIGYPFLTRMIRMKIAMNHRETGPNWKPCDLLIPCILPKS